ncbi:hypothetical protein PRIPAC_74454 [Pristionchus pacificus]|uniref:Uncharacterized protein n=1 Tax=Pristionchus pacificus TaxID=54126 RepID=A0A454XTW0_PRIPA|nr:hypothetical protein PRIPAC_74454 [Pristionchus pacificus]|eukprot:PDM74281.1 hypothetical protein PRIPAC_41637 [Pristionchus pacificus]
MREYLTISFHIPFIGNLFSTESHRDFKELQGKIKIKNDNNRRITMCYANWLTTRIPRNTTITSTRRSRGTHEYNSL